MTKKEFAGRCNLTMIRIYNRSPVCWQLKSYLGKGAYYFFVKHFKPDNKQRADLWYGRLSEENSSMRLAVFCGFINLVLETKEYQKW